jgi:hypothetical protein
MCILSGIEEMFVEIAKQLVDLRSPVQPADEKEPPAKKENCCSII